MNMLIYFLPAIILLGILTSYEDIKSGKIRNKWIVSSLIYALIVYLLLISFYFFNGTLRAEYLVELVTNFSFAMSVGFGMWYFGLWTAGDGKLFIAFSTLIPLSIYSNGYQAWTPSITLLINIFILGLIFMFGLIFHKSKFKGIKKISKDFLKDFFKVKKLLNSIISLFAIFWLVEIFFSLIGISSGYFLWMAATVSLTLLLQKRLKEKTIYILSAISFLRFFVDPSIYSLGFLRNFLILILVWKFMRSFIMKCAAGLGEELFSQEVKVKDLKPGMLLSDFIEKREKMVEVELKGMKARGFEVIKTGKVHYVRRPKSGLDLNGFIDEEAEGLTKEDIKMIKKTKLKKVRVAQTIPFAPLMFIGVILTLIAKGNILIVILNLF